MPSKTNDFATAVLLTGLRKFQINIYGIRDFIEHVYMDNDRFLSLGLMLRGALSDAINMRYLNSVREKLGSKEMCIETAVLDRDFIEAYERIIDNEIHYAKANAEQKKEIKDKFHKRYKSLYNGSTIKTKQEVRSESELPEKMKAYLKDALKDETLNYSTEAGKIKFVQDDDLALIEILYKYLSQLQHFSFLSRKVYSDVDFNARNPHMALLVLYYMVKEILKIMPEVAAHKETSDFFEDFVKMFVDNKE